MDLELFITLIVICSILLLVATISTCSHIPSCQKVCQRIVDLILVRAEQSHLDSLDDVPETVFKLQYKADIECVKQVSPAVSRKSLFPDTEELPGILTHPLPENLKRKNNRSTCIIVSPPTHVRETDVPC